MPEIAPHRRPLPYAFALCLAAAAACTTPSATTSPARNAVPPVRPAEPGATQVPPPSPDGRLPVGATPLGYVLHLDVDPRRERFRGVSKIKVALARPTSAIVLHGHEMVIDRATAGTPGGVLDARATFRLAGGAKEGPEELVLAFARPLPAGNVDLEIAFSAAFDKRLRGLYRVQDGERWFAFTQFEAVDARRAFPCFDEPGFKVPFELSITTPSGMTAVANTPQRLRSDDGPSKTTTYTFEKSPPLPSYLVAIAVGALEIREGTTSSGPPGSPGSPTPVRLITTPGKSHLGDLALAATANFVKILGDYFGRAYPYAKLDIVAVPAFAYGAMENAGLVTFREELLLLDPKHASTSARRRMALVIAHELAHQWFGDLVTMKWWNDVWLNEGFATWMQAKACDQWQPSLGARVDLVGEKGKVMVSDMLPSARPVRMPVLTSDAVLEAGGWTSYIKGSSVLSMLERWLGEDVFRAGIRGYIEANAWKNVEVDDLLRALSQVSGKDVAAVATSFLDQPGLPLLRASLDCAQGAPPRVRLEQSRFGTTKTAGRGGSPGRAGEKASRWRVPVCVRFEDGGASRVACSVIGGDGGAEGSIVLPLAPGKCPKWIDPNADDAGYYRFALSPEGFRALSSHALPSNGHGGLDVRERVGLVTGAWALVAAGEIGIDALFDVFWDLRAERARHVVEEMVNALTAIDASVVDDANRAKFRGFVAALLGATARRVGFDPAPREDEDTKLLRRAVLGALADFAEDPWAIAEAEKRAVAYLRDPASIDADTAAVALHIAARRATPARMEALEKALARATTPEQRIAAVVALGSIGDPTLLERALDLFVSGVIKAQDYRYLRGAAERRADTRAVFRRWVERRFDALHALLPGAGWLVSVAGGVCDRGARDEAAKFFGDRIASLEGAARELEEALAQADLCIAVREREMGRATEWLGKGRR